MEPIMSKLNTHAVITLEEWDLGRLRAVTDEVSGAIDTAWGAEPATIEALAGLHRALDMGAFVLGVAGGTETVPRADAPRIIQTRRRVFGRVVAAVRKARRTLAATGFSVPHHWLVPPVRVHTSYIKAPHTARGGGKKGGRGKRRTRQIRPLTARQAEAVRLYAEHQGKLTHIARAMGVSHPTAKQHLEAAFSKLPADARPRTARVGRVRCLPVDHRGQATVADSRR